MHLGFSKVSTSNASIKYRPDIDGLRAIAVLAVVLFHAFPEWVPGGFIGVDIFFVISGFLISTILFEGLSASSFSFINFYSRRIRRIFPALITILLVSLALGWCILVAREYEQLGKHVFGGASFLSNFVLWKESGYFDNTSDTKPLLHLWSLGRRKGAKSEVRACSSEGSSSCPHEKKHRRVRGGCLRHSWQGRPKQRGRQQLEAKQSVGRFSRWGSGGNNTLRHKPSA